MKAEAIVFREAGRPRLEKVELPDLEKGQALVKIHYSGVSIGTESSIFTGERIHNGTFPMTTGYMASGVVEKVADDVACARPGDKVVSSGTKFQGGINSVWGGHCSRHVVDASELSPVPSGCDMRDAAMFVMPCVGLNAVEMAGVGEDDIALISGQGLIGQFFGQWAAARGARVIAVEPDPVRARLSEKNVTKDVRSPFACDLEKEVEKLTGGQWPSVVVEATANKKLVRQATRLIRRMRAKMIFLSWYPGEIQLDYSHFHNWEALAFFPMGAGNKHTTKTVLEGLASGAIRMGGNITDAYEFQDAVKGFERICEKDRSMTGMVVDWRNAR